MNPALPDRHYDRVARTFHWLVVLLVIMQYGTELSLPSVLSKAAQDSLVGWHLSLGPTILLVMLLRLAWRLTHAPPAPPATLPPLLRLISRATHWLFYGVLIVLPVLGWTAASAYGDTAHLFGIIDLPRLVATDKPLAEAVGRAHRAIALGLLALIALHVAGALYHALVKRDGVMRRMLSD